MPLLPGIILSSFFNTYAVKLEKAEILEKTISYIKKLQDLTGDKCMRMGSETENSHSDGENIHDFLIQSHM